MVTEAYRDGFRSGFVDRFLLGRRSEYSSFLESATGYSRDYALGYRAAFGWTVSKEQDFSYACL